MKKVFGLFLSALLFAVSQASACTIVSATKHGEVFVAANEDDYIPFARIWFNPRTKDRYGSVCFGQSDLQAQAAVNEYGLFFDFTAQDIDPSKYKLKNPYYGDLFFEIAGKCKTIDEALQYMKKKDFPYSSQAILADATGRSVLVNAGGITKKKSGFQCNINCNLIAGKVSCRRQELVEKMLSDTKTLSVPFFKKLLDQTHQEGNLTTQYSSIYDLKRGLIYVYLFHDFNNVHVIDVKKELKKGYRLKNLDTYFPTSFAYESLVQAQPQYRKEQILSEINKKGLDNIRNHYVSVLNSAAKKDSALNDALLEVALQLVKDSWNQHQDGAKWEYWFSLPGGYNIRHFEDRRLNAAAQLLESLIVQQLDNPKLANFMYEISGFIYLTQGKNASAKKYYERAVANRAETYEVSYLRATEMLRRIQK